MVFYIIRSLPPVWWVICVYIYRVDFAWVDSFDGNIHRWENFPSSKITISKYVKAPNDKNTERRKRKRTRVSASHFSIQFFLFLLLRVFRYKVIPTQFLVSRFAFALWRKIPRTHLIWKVFESLLYGDRSVWRKHRHGREREMMGERERERNR